ncbi:putative ribonuclease H-like domain-containing protein [Tanacetum coccineum]
MKFESAQSNTTAKLPILKLGEYEMWVIKIKQYFQVQDYALWEVMRMELMGTVPQTSQENYFWYKDVNSCNSKVKTNKKNDVKGYKACYSCSSHEQHLHFSQYSDAKTHVCWAITHRFWSNEATKKTTEYTGITAPRNKRESFKYQDNTRKQGNNEDTSSKAMLAIDGVGFDWSDMAEEQVQTNITLMAFSDSELYNHKTCSKTCLKNYETLKKQFDDLIVKLNQTEFTAATYKRGLETVEEQLIAYRKNEVLFSEEVAVQKRELLESQITDKSKKGLGYNDVPPPHPLIYNRPKKLDLSYSGLDEFKDPEFKSYGSEDSKQESNIVCDKKSDDSKENSNDSLIEFVNRKTHEKPVKKSVRVNYNYTTNRTHPNAQRNMVPRAVLMKTGLKLFNTARTVNTAHPKSTGKPQQDDTGFIDSGYSRHMTGNIVYLSDFKEYEWRISMLHLRLVAHGSRISVRNTIKTDSLDFEDVYFVNELNFNLFSVSQMCDKKNYVLFTDTKCLVLSPNFKFPDKSHILLKIPRRDNMYSVDMKNIVPKESLTCLVAKATSDESMLWYRRLGHINFKNINKLVKDNLVRGFPTKRFENDQTCVACLKGKQHRSSCMSKDLNHITKPLFMLHMDLFGPTFVSSLMHKKYCLVVTDDYSREKGIKREYSVARTPQQKSTSLLGKFDGKSDEGFFVGYSLSSKAFRVYNTRTRRVEENLHIGFLENKPMIEGNGPKWLFDIDSLTQSMNYVPVAAGTISNESAGTQGELNAGTSTQKEEISQDCIVMPIWKDASYFDSPSKDVSNVEPNFAADYQKQVEDGPHNESDEKDKSEDDSSPKEVNAAGQHVNTASPEVNTDRFKQNIVDPSVNTVSLYELDSPKDMFKLGASHTLETTHVEFFSDEDEPEVDLGNITNSYTVPTTPNTRIHKDHPIKNVIGDVKSSIQTRRMSKSTSKQGFLSAVYEQKTHDTLNTCLYACFLSQIEPTSIAKALSDSSWVEAMQEELLQFKLQQVWKLVDLPNGKKAIGTKWVFRNKKDERGIIEEEVYVCQPPGFEDPNFPDKVYKVEKALYGLHQAPRAWYETLSTYLLDNGFHRGQIDKTLFIKRHKDDILLVQVYVDDIIFGSTKKELSTEFEKLMHDKFQMSSMGELTFFLGLQVQQKSDGIFISQDKYVAEILKKFDFATVKTASTPIETNKALVKDEEAEAVDVHLYRSMIGSLMYLTASRPDIMFAVCACARFQVTPKTSHLHAVKRIFRYLKGQSKLGLWYPRDSPFDLEAFSDSDYAGASLDRKSTTGGCQFLGKRLISWQCKKQTIVANSTTEAEYVAAANCCGQVLWIQNQMLDYGFNFMNTKIYIDNESTICIVKNPVFYSKTKHIKIRNHFIRDSYEKRLIQVIKIHTDYNVADLLTKAFDVSRLSILSIWYCIEGRLMMSICSQELMKGHVGDEAVHKELGDRMERAATTASSLEAEQDSEFCDTHNMVTFLNKSEGNEDFHQIIDFLTISHIKYALTENPTIYNSLIQQFWETTYASTSENEEMEITATIDGRVKTITQASIRRHLKLEYDDGISSLPNTAIFEQLGLRGNMRRVSKGYTGVDIPLFPTMLTAPESSPSRITSSPSLSPQTHPSTSQQPPTPPFMQSIHDAEEPATMSLDSSQPRVQSLGSDEGSLTLNELTVLYTTLSKKVEDLQNDLKQTKLTYGAAYTKLILRVKKLEHKVKASKSRRRARVIISDNEEDLEDSSKQGRIIAEIDQNPSISLVQDEGTSWIQEDADIQGRNSADTEILLEEPTELVEDFGSGEKELSTVIPEVSTAAENLVYIRRSAEKRKDKGKAIMKEDESVQKKTKKQLEQERLSHEATIRLQEQVNEEERQRIARDAEIAKQLPKEIDTARQEQEKSDLEKALELQKSFSKAEVKKYMCMYLKNQGEYKQSHFKGMSYKDIRPIFERIGEVSGSVEEQSAGKEKDVSEEELKKLLVIVPVEEVYIEALHVKYPTIDWERFDRDDLEKLWDLVKKKFSSTEPTVDKEKVLWVELKRLFKPDDDDTLWKLQRYMHDPLKWRLYDTCGVHHVFTERGHDIFMLVEKDYPLTRALMIIMLANKFQVDESSEMANELLRKIIYQVERTRT